MKPRKTRTRTYLPPLLVLQQARGSFCSQLNRKMRVFPSREQTSVNHQTDEILEQRVELENSTRAGHNLNQIALFDGKYEPQFVEPIDLEQGQTDNCYVVTEMIELIRSDPGAIKRLIRPKGNGIYEVTIQINPNSNAKPGKGTRQEVTILVDDTLPTSTYGNKMFTQIGEVNADGKPELWVMLLEKAYAIYWGGANTMTWKHPGEAMASLSANRSDVYYNNRFNEQQIANLINHAISKQLSVTTNTPAMSQNVREQAKMINPGIEERLTYNVKQVHLSSLTIDLQSSLGSKYDVTGLPLAEFRRFFTKFIVSR